MTLSSRGSSEKLEHICPVKALLTHVLLPGCSVVVETVRFFDRLRIVVLFSSHFSRDQTYGKITQIGEEKTWIGISQ